MPTHKNIKTFLYSIAGVLIFPTFLFANSFNQLVKEKQILEKQFGVKTLECFPFKKEIGFTEDQIPLIEQCLKGATSLKKAFAQVNHKEYKEVGISNRFLRTAGFHTALVNWQASPVEMAEFLNQRLKHQEQVEFLDKIRALKKEIRNKGYIKEFYCSKEISNANCLKGYENLSAVNLPQRHQKKSWHEIMITHSPSSSDTPYKLILGFDQSPVEMKNRIMKDPYETWKPQRKMYEAIQEKYGKIFKDKLQLENFICASEISLKECEQGAKTLIEASKSTDFRMRYWGKIILNRHNTIIEDDFHSQMRFDLPAKKVVEHFSRKANKTKAAEDTTLAVKLEGRTKNNPSKLRAVCDLQGLTAALCAKAFKTFIKFVKSNRDYQVALPWDTLMFIDGTQLARVNFALNSNARTTYLYIDAQSNEKQFSSFLNNFRDMP